MTVSTLKKKLILQAVNVLRDSNKLYYEDSSKKKPLLGSTEENALYLQINLKKIPKKEAIKMIKVKLPHSLIKDTHEVCLITGDLDKNNRKAEIEPDILHYKALLEKHGITQISEIITLRQLRTEYKPYEAKQKLLAAYDLFIADNTITHCLPSVLGKHFFKKRKFPIQINMKAQNLKQQIEKALSTKVFYITSLGNTCVAEVAYLDMNNSEIVDNVRTMAQELYKELPGSWDNVMGMYLRTAKSKAIPIYVSYDSPNEVQLQESPELDDNMVVADESDYKSKLQDSKDDNRGDVFEQPKKTKKKKQNNVSTVVESEENSFQKKKNKNEPAGQKKASVKRKRDEKESLIQNCDETPVKVKKRRIDGVSTQRYQIKKEFRRNNKKKNGNTKQKK